MEGMFVGSRCLTSVDGRWSRATIRAVFADGTVKVDCDQPSMVVLPSWYGVTRAELRFDDEALWPQAREVLSLPDRFGADELAGLFQRRGWSVKREDVGRFCAHHAALDGYSLFLAAGFNARDELAHARGEPTPEPSGRIYWNQLRMGGRDPAEVARTITVEDALAAIGIADHTRDLPRHGALPVALRRYFACLGDAKGLAEIQSNNPEVVRPTAQPMEGLRAEGLAGDLGVVVMRHFDFEWVAVFDAGDADARLYVRWGDEGDCTWRLAAPTVGFFFWDVAQTALAWWNDTKFRGGKPVVTTDVGVALVG